MSGWTVYGDPWESGELANTNKFQTIKYKDNIILKAIRTWVIVVNDPTFTNLTMKIYSNTVVSSDNTPVKLLYTSTNTLTKSEIITLANGVKEIYFTFDDVPMQEETLYNLVINGAGYVYSSSSHLAWMKAWPDPVYTAGYTPTSESLAVAPYQVYAIGGKF